MSYWSPICELVSQFRCWVRVSSKVGLSTEEGRWGQLLTIPTHGYLEGPGGPYPLRDIEWIELSTSRVRGGMAGHPLQFVDIKDQILERLREIRVTGTLRDSLWSIPRVFEGEPVQVVRIVNPFGPMLV